MSKLPGHNDWVRSFCVSNPTRHKKGYTIYKVVSKVFPKNSVEAASQVVVWKRYSDFRKLYKALFHLYQGLHLKGNFPKFAKASYFGRFEEETVEERRKAALCLLEFAAQYPVLFNSQVFVKFFENSQECHDDVEREMLGLRPPLLAPPSKPSDSSSNQCANNAADLAGGDCSSEVSWGPSSTADAVSLDSRTTTEEEADQSTRSMAAEGEEEDRHLTSHQTSPTGFLRPDIAEFDPILQKDDSDDLASLSNAWILSAADACACLGDESTPAPSGPAFVFPGPVKETVEEEADDWTELELKDDSCEGRDMGRLRHESSTSFTPGTPVSPLDAEGVGYLHEATSYAAKAYACEAQGDFVGAFSLYKVAVSSLLEGVQKDSSASRRDAVRRKTAQYLARAEQIYEHRLARRMEGERRWSLSQGPEVLESCAPTSGSTSAPTWGPGLRGPVQDLKHYKVIGVVGTVLLVLDMRRSQTVVIKVLHKSPSGSTSGRPSVVPQGVPHMAQLLCLYETDCSYFLVLEYAPGGRLWDCLAPYFTNRLPLPSPACEVSCAGSPSSPLNGPPARPCLPSGQPVPVPPSECDFAIACSESQASISAASIVSALDETSLIEGGITSSEQPLVSTTDVSRIQTDTNENSLQLPFVVNTLPSQNSVELSKVSNSCDTLGLEKSIKSINILAVDKPNKKLAPQLCFNKNRSQVVGRSLEDIVGRNNALNVPASKAESHSYSGEHLMKQETRKDGPKSVGSPRKPVKRSLSSQAAQAFRELDSLSKQLAKPSHLPEACIRLWAAETVMALGHLHRLGVIRQDLCPHDILLGEGGHVVLTYCCYFNCVDRSPSQFARENQYCAPEIDNLGPVTPACDWWSLGALLYELFVEAPLILCHPGGITPSTRLYIPAHVSAEGADLLEKLLAYHAHQRLGYGPTGTEDVKCHPFFATIDWKRLSLPR
ncbi:ribosomal protein S6 kinase-like 1 isoform X2 [Dermacentor albipictus]|uniref:ribosomal protein S6 kinase-like 1 isoform X2 n=1 Tax=Dermacentor albipictus TaxID=60249 RepID=UPI0038FC28AD